MSRQNDAQHSSDADQRRPPGKQRYESNVDVQRWLSEETPEQSGRKPPFDPPFLSEHHERLWLLSSLVSFYDQDLIRDVVSVAKSGKEATVYCCEADPAVGARYLAAKIYRPRMFRSLKNDVVYRHGRDVYSAEGKPMRGRRARRAAHKGSERGRALQVNSWIQHEFRTQQLLHAAGGDVPAALAQAGNGILMEYIGDERSAAPLLRQVSLEPAEAPRLLARLLHNIALFLAHHRIHGDLSPYNILYWQGHVCIIDFAQAVDPRHNDQALALLERDVDRTCRYFRRYGIAVDAAALAAELWTGYLLGDLDPADFGEERLTITR